MATIRTLKPNVSRSQAVEQFTGGALGFAREFVSGPLRSVADFYIPFLVFDVCITNRGEQQKQIWGIDAVNGSLDPYHFGQVPGTEDSLTRETRNCLLPTLPLHQAEQSLITKVQRLLFTSGFFRVWNLAIRVTPIPGEIYIPYWAGFRGHGLSASIAVLDAVRRQPEGARVRRLLEDWLTAGTCLDAPAALPANS